MKKALIACMFVVFAVAGSTAAVRLPKIFSDNMVLQRDAVVKIWGWSEKKWFNFPQLQWADGKSESKP